MQYKLPIASADTLGGVKIGSTLEINQDGTVDVKGMNELQEAYEESISSIAAGKTVIASAITEKGVPTEAEDSFQGMADNIGKISSGGASGIFKVWAGAGVGIGGMIESGN